MHLCNSRTRSHIAYRHQRVTRTHQQKCRLSSEVAAAPQVSHSKGYDHSTYPLLHRSAGRIIVLTIRHERSERADEAADPARVDDRQRSAAHQQDQRKREYYLSCAGRDETPLSWLAGLLVTNNQEDHTDSQCFAKCVRPSTSLTSSEEVS